MLLSEINLNSKTNQKPVSTNSGHTDKQDSKPMNNGTLNFKGGPAMSVIGLPRPVIRRSSLQIIPRPILEALPNELTTFLTRHKDIFKGLDFEKQGENFVSTKANPWQASIIADDYSQAFNNSLIKAAETAKATATGVKVFLEELLTLRTKVFTYEVKKTDGIVTLSKPVDNGHFFHDATQDSGLLSSLNPKLDAYIVEYGLGGNELSLADKSKYYVTTIEQGFTIQDGANPFEATFLNGIWYTKLNPIK